MNKCMSTDEFVTTTLVTLANMGDYLITVEQSLITVCDRGLAQIEGTLGDSAIGKSFAAATKRRYLEGHSRAFRYSSIILIFTTFESRIVLFMEDYEKRYGDGPKIKSPSSFVDGILSYMNRHPRPIRLSRPKIWDRLRDFNVVRNCIAHGGGLHRLIRKGDSVPEIAKSSQHLEVGEDGYLMIDDVYALEACELITIFFNMVFNAACYSIDIPSEMPAIILGDSDEFHKKIDEYYSSQGL